MASTAFTDSAPLDFIDFLFGNLACCATQEPYDEALKKLAEKLDANFLATNSFQLPSLNVKKSNKLKPYSLVRFRCMIQDMKEPEILPACLNSKSMATHSFFRDYVEWPTDYEFSADKVYITRHVFTCVPIPSETIWVKQIWHELEENSGLITPSSSSTELRHNAKRYLEDEEIMESSVDNESSALKRRNTDKTPSSEKVAVSLDESCIVKVYSDGETYKLNECLEFVGVWNRNEVDSKIHCSLHAICAKRLPHLHPKLMNTFRESRPSDSSMNDRTTRAKLLGHLQSILFGDSLAAEYLLCLLVSTVIHRETMCIGKFALNLHNIPEHESSRFVDKVKNSLCHLFTKVHYLPLSLDVLNKERFVPYKNYDSDTLCTGRLQLSAGTLLIIDETKLNSGQLNEYGIRNIAALKTLILHQKVDYDFLYHNIEFKSDVNVLILSEGPSCLPSDYALPVHKTSDASPTEDLDQISADEFRSYLIRMKRTDLEISGQVQGKIQDDFVEMRRQDNNVNDTKLHQLLVLARWLMCTSGCVVLEEEHWERAKSMEIKRSERKRKQ